MFGIDKNKEKNGEQQQVKDRNEVEQKKETKDKDNVAKTDKSQHTDSQDRPLQKVRPSDKPEAPDTTATLQPVANAEPEDWLGSNRDPDVMLSVPNLGIDHIGLNVKNLHAHVDLNAKVLDLVQLHVGADVGIEEVDLQIDNVRVQAMLKVKLEKVKDIVGDVVGLLDHHPEILSDLTGGLGRGLEGALARKPGSENQLSSQEKDRLRKLLQQSEKKKESNKNPESSKKIESSNNQESDKQQEQESDEQNNDTE
ncbi:hypothetical protein MYP_3215 [Sporocytophaga myxococcoides]|uniref:Uncharacterized protein n=2 Tax=Sporocytophaga myxococcoides TaxID=153721 RepID=A0A098LG81_9BACT|nr:hypothetical protein MYP_3215 [Sporocytophaga myxococcoides]